MILKHLELTNFRNIKKKEIDFSEKITAIIGANAAGKTNILESIFLLSTGKSFKARLEEEMINYERDLARVIGEVNSKQDKVDGEKEHFAKLEVILTRGEIAIEEGVGVTKAPRKKLLVNNLAKRLIDFSGNLKVVLFGPWDLDLVTESPSVRRKFMDNVLSQVDREYRRSVLSYEKGLRQRNKLLFRIREEGASRSQLIYWNHLLIKNGDYISQKREELIDFINSNSDQLPISNFLITYDKSAISETRLEQYKDEEVAAATTLVGPHRDDFVFGIKDLRVAGVGKREYRDLAAYGSRGEQRMGVLWLKLSELFFIEEKTSEKPVLLLDDIFSELDHEHRGIVMAVSKKQQTIITTADPHYLEDFESLETVKL